MSILAIITKIDDVDPILSRASLFAEARDANLGVLCWNRSPLTSVSELSLAEAEELESSSEEARGMVSAIRKTLDEDSRFASRFDGVVLLAQSPTITKVAIEQIASRGIHALVAAAPDRTGSKGATYATNPLLKQSPCHALILFPGSSETPQENRVMALMTGRPHDRAAISLAGRIAKLTNAEATIVSREDEIGEGEIEAARRELLQQVRDTGMEKSSFHAVVLSKEEPEELISLAEKHDLILTGPDTPSTVRLLRRCARRPTIVVIKRAPPIRAWRFASTPNWVPRLSPADFADLVTVLRRGSRLSADFLTMLGLAAVIATSGLLQNSPAVVIGSMLLAPLMTPMVGLGLALAQANPLLGRRCWKSIFAGFFIALVTSFLVAHLTPGEEVTSEVMGRGNPNLLDFRIAIFSAIAASYALARPNLVGSVAGVAIATALVPPLCSVGISLAYHQYPNAMGAVVLFAVNLVAIILGSAITFLALGVARIGASQSNRLWANVNIVVLASIVIGLWLPLESELEEDIRRGKPQPNSYPLTYALKEALEDVISDVPGVDLVLAGRPTSSLADSDVILVLSSLQAVPQQTIDKLTQVVRSKMHDEEAIVEVHCLKETQPFLEGQSRLENDSSEERIEGNRE